MIRQERVLEVYGTSVRTTGGNRSVAGNLPMAVGDFVEVWDDVVMGWKRRQGTPVLLTGGPHYLFMELLDGVYFIVKRDADSLDEMERTEVTPPSEGAECILFVYSETKQVSVWQTASGGLLRVNDEDAGFTLNATDFYAADGYLDENDALVWVHARVNIDTGSQLAVFTFFTNDSVDRTVDLSEPVADAFGGIGAAGQSWNASVEAAVTWTHDLYQTAVQSGPLPEGEDWDFTKVPVPSDDPSRAELEQTAQSCSLVYVFLWEAAVLVDVFSAQAVIIGLQHPMAEEDPFPIREPDFRRVRPGMSQIIKSCYISGSGSSVLLEKKSSYANVKYYQPYGSYNNYFVHSITLADGEYTILVHAYAFGALLGNNPRQITTGDMVTVDYKIDGSTVMKEKTVYQDEYVDVSVFVETDPEYQLIGWPWTFVLSHEDDGYVLVDKAGWSGEHWVIILDAEGNETDKSLMTTADIKNSRIKRLT